MPSLVEVRPLEAARQVREIYASGNSSVNFSWPHPKSNRSNDAVCDPRKCFLAGSIAHKLCS